MKIPEPAIECIHLDTDSQTEYTQVLALPNQTDQELSFQLVTTTQGS